MSVISESVQASVRAKIIKKRIPQDVKKMLESKDFDAVLAEPGNMNVIWVRFKNAEGFYRNQMHVLEITLETTAHSYPFTSPNVRFLTPVFHTNISTAGSICLSILKGKSQYNTEGWTESYTLCSTVQSIFLLLENPNTESPFNSDASKAWMDCRQGLDAEKYMAIIDNYYSNQNYQKVLAAFENRYKENCN